MTRHTGIKAASLGSIFALAFGAASHADEVNVLGTIVPSYNTLGSGFVRVGNDSNSAFATWGPPDDPSPEPQYVRLLGSGERVTADEVAQNGGVTLIRLLTTIAEVSVASSQLIYYDFVVDKNPKSSKVFTPVLVDVTGTMFSGGSGSSWDVTNSVGMGLSSYTRECGSSVSSGCGLSKYSFVVSTLAINANDLKYLGPNPGDFTFVPGVGAVFLPEDTVTVSSYGTADGPAQFKASTDPTMTIDPSTPDAQDYQIFVSSGFGPGPAFTGAPEPKTWTMMIVGLALVGATARRRARVERFARG